MRRLEARPGPATAHGYRICVLPLPAGTAAWPCRPASRLSETAIAFAGEKWVFLVHFSGAEVMQVSRLPCWGASSGVVGFNVATLSRLVREKVRPAWPDVGVSAKKFALHAQNTPKSAFLRLLGELFRGRATGGAVLGEFIRGNAAGGAVLGEFFRANRYCAGLGCSVVHFRLAAVGVLQH